MWPNISHVNISDIAMWLHSSYVTYLPSSYIAYLP